MEAKKYLLVGFVILALTLFGCTGKSGGSEDWQVLEDTTIDITEGYYQPIVCQLEKGEQIKIEMKVKRGGNVNLMLANSLEYSDFSYYEGGGDVGKDLEFTLSKLNVNNVASEPITIYSSGIYYVVIDNSGAFANGATPSGPVTVNIKIYKSAG